MRPRFLQAILLRLPTAIQLAGRLFGFEIKRADAYARDDLRLTHLLAHHRVDLVFDVGANRGQFARSLFDTGYTGQIVSFEAVQAAHDNMTSRAAKRQNNWTIEPLGALGDRCGEVEFHVNAAETTSSLLAPSANSAASISELRPVSVHKVPVRRLDDVAQAYQIDSRRSFLKLDVQGGEALVLAGAQNSLTQVVGILIELSFIELYAGQPLAFDVLQPLLEMGFVVHDIYAAYRDPNTFQLAQADFVLFHKDRMNAGK